MNKKNNFGNIVIIVVFTFTIAYFLLSYIWGKDRKFSQMENRYLAQRPTVSINNLFGNDLNNNFEQYLSDQLIFRNTFVKLKNQSLKTIKVKNINNIYLANGDIYIENYIQNTKRIAYNIDCINEWFINNDLKKDKTYFILIPNKSCIQEDDIPKNNINESQLKSIQYIKNKLDKDIKFVDTYNILNENKENYIFYRTDHHLTMKGAELCYSELSELLCNSGLTDNESNQNKQITKVGEVSDFYGATYSKVPLFDAESDTMELFDWDTMNYYVEYINEHTNEINKIAHSYIDFEKLNEKDKYAAIFGGNFSLIKIKNENGNGKKILIFKDSFGNSIIPYMIKDFSEIDIIDLRYYDCAGLYSDSKMNIQNFGINNYYDAYLFVYNVDFINSDNNFLWLKK